MSVGGSAPFREKVPLTTVNVLWSGHNIPLTSRRETLQFAASQTAEERAAQKQQEGRSAGRHCANFWESDSGPSLLILHLRVGNTNPGPRSPSVWTTYIAHQMPMCRLVLRHPAGVTVPNIAERLLQLSWTERAVKAAPSAPALNASLPHRASASGQVSCYWAVTLARGSVWT